MAVNIERVEWQPDELQLEGFGSLIEMILKALIVQDDLRREKRGEPVTGHLELRMPDKLIEGIMSEAEELRGAIMHRDTVNQYEEMSDLLMRWARIVRTLDPELIIRIFFVKARAIAGADSINRQRDKGAERAAMEQLIAEHEGE